MNKEIKIKDIVILIIFLLMIYFAYNYFQMVTTKNSIPEQAEMIRIEQTATIEVIEKPLLINEGLINDLNSLLGKDSEGKYRLENVGYDFKDSTILDGGGTVLSISYDSEYTSEIFTLPEVIDVLELLSHYQVDFDYVWIGSYALVKDPYGNLREDSYLSTYSLYFKVSDVYKINYSKIGPEQIKQLTVNGQHRHGKETDIYNR